MNIFVLHTEPGTAARLHCDKHVIKMILESAQMLSSAIAKYGGTPRYKPTHVGHPCTRWAGETRDNFDWLVELALALACEYEHRYSPRREHRSVAVIRDAHAQRLLVPAGSLTPFAQAMPDKYKHADAVTAYRRFYAAEKARFATWRAPRVRPDWMP